MVFLLGLIALAAGLVYTESLQTNESVASSLITEAFETFSGHNGSRPFKGSDRMNILCLGIDYNRDSKGIAYTKGARSDTILVVSIDSSGKTLNVVSIPRDCYVFLGEEYGYDKINAAYMVGGIDLTRKVVSDFLDVPIHHYVIVKVSGAAQLVDALGGLVVDVEKDMDYDDNWGDLHIHLRKGEQLLKGTQAVGYARFRMDAEGDRGRMRRQQQMLKAVIKRLKDPMVVLRLQAIVKAFKQNIETDLSLTDMLDLTYLYKDFDRNQMKTGYIVGDDVDINGASCIEPYAPLNEKTVLELLKSPSDLRLKDVRIEVLNGSSREGLEGKLSEYLNNLGFKVVKVGKSEYQCDTTTIIDRLDSVAIHTGLDNLLKSNCVYETVPKSENDYADVTVIIGNSHADMFDRSEGSSAPRPAEEDYYNSEPKAEDGYDGNSYPKAAERSYNDDSYIEAPAEEQPEPVREPAYNEAESAPAAPAPAPAPERAEPAKPEQPDSSWKDTYDNNIQLNEAGKASSEVIEVPAEEAPESGGEGGIEPEAVYDDEGNPVDVNPQVVEIEH